MNQLILYHAAADTSSWKLLMFTLRLSPANRQSPNKAHSVHWKQTGLFQLVYSLFKRRSMLSTKPNNH